MKQDHVGRMLAAAGIKTTDATVVEVIARLHRVVSHIDDRLEETFSAFDLKIGEVDVLLTLALGPQEPQSPTGVASQVLCSSGAMTNRLDRLEKAGLIKRQHDTKDRRAILLSITPEGKKAAKRAAEARDALAEELLPGITIAERKTLVALLRKMLVAFESTARDE